LTDSEWNSHSESEREEKKAKQPSPKPVKGKKRLPPSQQRRLVQQQEASRKRSAEEKDDEEEEDRDDIIPPSPVKPKRPRKIPPSGKGLKYAAIKRVEKPLTKKRGKITLTTTDIEEELERKKDADYQPPQNDDSDLSDVSDASEAPSNSSEAPSDASEASKKRKKRMIAQEKQKKRPKKPQTDSDEDFEFRSRGTEGGMWNATTKIAEANKKILKDNAAKDSDESEES